MEKMCDIILRIVYISYGLSENEFETIIKIIRTENITTIVVTS